MSNWLSDDEITKKRQELANEEFLAKQRLTQPFIERHVNWRYKVAQYDPFFRQILIDLGNKYVDRGQFQMQSFESIVLTYVDGRQDRKTLEYIPRQGYEFSNEELENLAVNQDRTPGYDKTVISRRHWNLIPSHENSDVTFFIMKILDKTIELWIPYPSFQQIKIVLTSDMNSDIHKVREEIKLLVVSGRIGRIYHTLGIFKQRGWHMDTPDESIYLGQ